MRIYNNDKAEQKSCSTSGAHMEVEQLLVRLQTPNHKLHQLTKHGDRDSLYLLRWYQHQRICEDCILLTDVTL